MSTSVVLDVIDVLLPVITNMINLSFERSTLFFFNKNKLNKNIEAEIARKIRTIEDWTIWGWRTGIVLWIYEAGQARENNAHVQSNVLF